jgi:hypothetical protein
VTLDFSGLPDLLHVERFAGGKASRDFELEQLAVSPRRDAAWVGEIKPHTAEEVVAKLRQVDVLRAGAGR